MAERAGENTAAGDDAIRKRQSSLDINGGGNNVSRAGSASDEPLKGNVNVVTAETFAFSEDRKMGVMGAAFLILNKMIGTGIFSTPSNIFASAGSVGISLMLWVAGGILALCGLSIYLEFGLAIPRSGGEKNYLERVYRRPKHLATCILLSRLLLLGFATSNSLAFGRYVLFATGRHSTDGWATRGIGVAAITFAVVLHATLPKWGIRLSNVLGIFKVFVLLVVVCAGFAALAGHRLVPDPHNFDDAFKVVEGDGYGAGSAYTYANALLNVIHSYNGWENANYVLSEVRNPRRTLTLAAPLAVGGVTILYVLANIAYFAAIPKAELAKSELLVAGLFFRNVFGGGAAAKCLPVFVALSNMGTILVISFAHGRVNQELAKESLLPYSQFWASNKPFNAPTAGLFLHWLITVIVLIAPPFGPAYNFIISLTSYTTAWINAFVTIGLIWLQYKKSENWASPWHTILPVSIVYLLSNIFLFVVPFVPPTGNWNSKGYPYYMHPVIGVTVLLLGVVYWAIWTQALPRIGGYKLVSERTFDENGGEVVKYQKIPVK